MVRLYYPNKEEPDLVILVSAEGCNKEGGQRGAAKEGGCAPIPWHTNQNQEASMLYLTFFTLKPCLTAAKEKGRRRGKGKPWSISISIVRDSIESQTRQGQSG